MAQPDDWPLPRTAVVKGNGGQDQDPSGPTQFHSLTISTNYLACLGLTRLSNTT